MFQRCLALLLSATFTISTPAEDTLLVLGDSLAYGFATPTTTPRTTGDRGYARGFADWLATQSDGVRPRLINLGVPAESSVTFFDGGAAGTFYNSNYSLFSPKTQWQLMTERISSEISSGNQIEWVTIHLGANDMFDITDSAGFFSLSPAQQQVLFDSAIATHRTNLDAIIARVKNDVPGARVVLLGYYNPFAAVPSDPLHPFGVPIAGQLNDAIRALAADFGATFVNLYDPFLGREAELTLIVSDDDIHPTPEGYDEITRLLIAAVSCRVDLNGDGVLDFFDVSAFLAAYGAGEQFADLSGDGILDFFDVSLFLSEFSAGCP